MLGVQQKHRLSLLCPSLAVQQVVFGLSGSVLNLRQHVPLLLQPLRVVCDQIHVVDQPASAHSDSHNQVRGSTCCFWDVRAFGMALIAQRVEVQAGHVQWAQMSKGVVWRLQR
jgi:hypothetical protein